MVLRAKQILVIIFSVLILLSGCQVEEPDALQFPEDPGQAADVDLLDEPKPERVLSICLGDEPSSLFIYGDLSTSANIIRQAIYDGPIDEVDFQISSPLLSEIPSLENGLVSLSAVGVFPGERMVDVDGNPTILASGVVYRPSGCTGEDCFEIFQDQSSITLDQVEIRFPLKGGITWSDGEPVTPEDSLFSYKVAGLIYETGGPRKIRYASDYQILDDDTARWIGLPGFTGIISYSDYFFSPLPQHTLGDVKKEGLALREDLARNPLGWGAYQVAEWVEGDHITLYKNERYHRITEGLPAFDSLVFRFVNSGEEALAAFRAGECQVLANTSGIIEYLPQLLEDEKEGLLNITYLEGSAWEQISFGVDSLDSQRTALQDSRLRQAIAMCINREEIASMRGDAGNVVDSFFFPGDPRIETSQLSYPYQPGIGMELLEEIGWMDHDQDSSTPRRSQEVENQTDDTELRLSLLVPGDGEPSLTAKYIQEDLSDCGIELVLEILPASELLAPGPEGPVFGRQFDLALFAWAVGSYQRCQLFLSSEIPGSYPDYGKGWGGVNAPGYSRYEFDSACRDLMLNPPDFEGNQFALKRIIEIITDDLPVLPMFFRRNLIISSPDLIPISSGYFPPLWNIEDIR